MDLDKLNQGEKIAGIAGIVLLISLWLAWYSGAKVNGIEVPGAGSASGWEALSLIDIIVFITAVVAIASAFLAANEGDAGLPVALSAVVTALGALSVLLILFRIIDVPTGDIPRRCRREHRPRIRHLRGADSCGRGHLRWLSRHAGRGNLVRRPGPLNRA